MTRPFRLRTPPTPGLPLPALAAATVVAVLGGALLLTGGVTSTPPSGPSSGPVLDADDRAALDAGPVARGAEAPLPDPGVTLDDPEAVVRAYLTAALSVTAADAGSTHRRAAPYAVPGSGPATVGVLVLDAPAPGAARAASVRDLELVAADRGDRRRGYRADVETRTGPPGGPVATAVVTRSVVVARQPDGRWLVAVDAGENPDLVMGED